MTYILYLLILVCIYLVLAISLNLSLGYGGMLSLCHGAIYGLGAYVATLLMVKAHWPFIFAAFSAVAAGAVAGLCVSLCSARLKRDFFVLATISFQMIAFTVLYNWVDVTRGPFGIPAIPRPEVLGWTANSPASFAVLAVVAAVGAVLVSCQLSRSPYGRALRAVREDELAAAALGKNAMYFRATVMLVSGALAASAGVLYCTHITYIDPTSFGIEESVLILTVLIVGGAGNQVGPVLGALIITLLPEGLRFLQVPDLMAPNIRQMAFGLLLIVMMRFRPQGLAGDYALT